MSVVEILLSVFAEMFYVCIYESFFFCNLQYFSTVSGCEEFSVSVEEFQCVPVARVVRCGDNDASVCTCHCYGEFGCWS